MRHSPDSAISDGLVDGDEALVAALTLPDPDDRHVLAAAIRCGQRHMALRVTTFLNGYSIV